MKLPKSLKEITVGQWIALRDNKKIPDHKRTSHQLSVLGGISIEEAQKISIEKAKKYIDQLAFLSEDINTSKPKMKFKINGKRYQVIADAKKLSAGQYMRAQSILKDIANDELTIDKNLHLILANVCVPLKRKWFKFVPKTEYDVSEVAQEIKNHLSVAVAYPIVVFFCNLSKHLTPIIEDYLVKEQNKVNKILSEVQTDLLNHTAGI